MGKFKPRLRRLDAKFYQDQAWVHWTLCIEDRKRGWLDRVFHLRFRELLTHACFRSQIACPVYCLMPDHMHILWCGLSVVADQLKGMRFFRKDLNQVLLQNNYRLQNQAFDHVLTPKELEANALECTVEYIARNPERAGIVAKNCFAEYPYSRCLLPGYPNFELFKDKTWSDVCKVLSYLRAKRESNS